MSIGIGRTVERSTGGRWEPDLSVSYSPECVEGRFSELRPEGFGEVGYPLRSGDGSGLRWMSQCLREAPLERKQG